MVTVKTPVSLVIAGEWASREEGNHCIASAISKNIIVSLDQGSDVVVQAPALNIENVIIDVKKWSVKSKKSGDESTVETVVNAIKTVGKYLTQQGIKFKPFTLTINADHILMERKNGNHLCVDFNVDATITVAIIKAILQHHEQSTTSASAKQVLFKLSFIALYEKNNHHTFGCEIAASIHSGTIMYQQTNLEAFKKLLATHHNNLAGLIEKPWLHTKITMLNMPEELKLCVCLIEDNQLAIDICEKIEVYKKNYPIRYRQLCASINLVVLELAKSIETNANNNILELIRQNKQLLKNLLEESGNKKDAPALNTLINCAEECGAAAKFTSTTQAGFGFAVCLDRFTAQKIKRKWEKKGVQMLNTQLLG